MATSIDGNDIYRNGTRLPKIRCFKHYVSSDIQTDGSTTIPFSTFTNQINDFNQLIGVFANLGVMLQNDNIDISVEWNGMASATNRDFIRLVARSAADVQKGYICVLIVYS
jgi:hypothetical protein